MELVGIILYRIFLWHLFASKLSYNHWNHAITVPYSRMRTLHCDSYSTKNRWSSVHDIIEYCGAGPIVHYLNIPKRLRCIKIAKGLISQKVKYFQFTMLLALVQLPDNTISCNHQRVQLPDLKNTDAPHVPICLLLPYTRMYFVVKLRL